MKKNSAKKNAIKCPISINCNGKCAGWFHKECSGHSDKSFLDISKKDSKIIFKCMDCKDALQLQSNGDSSDSEDEPTGGGSKRNLNQTRNKTGPTHNVPSYAEIKKLIKTEFNDLERLIQYNSDTVNDLKAKDDTLLHENHKLKEENKSIKTRMS
ncbi:hypothetical protein HHI36_010326 [Cryptolaemus montrouzieri]|uniref:PHD-type domain-containing protein n=1 Tax=Cryptolaemus montrouzieri TaxID=559131 RepID=A0ABD2MJ63_9CUCU